MLRVASDMSSPIKKQRKHERKHERKLSERKTERQYILSPEGKEERQRKIEQLKYEIMRLKYDEETAVREQHEEDMKARQVARASMPAFQLESVRAGVKMATIVQAGERIEALDGDGHTIKKIGFYKGKVPDAWIPEIVAALDVSHDVGESGWTEDDNPRNEVKGIYSLSFHEWVAYKLVKPVDPKFKPDDCYTGRGFAAQGIARSLKEWANRA